MVFSVKEVDIFDESLAFVVVHIDLIFAIIEDILVCAIFGHRMI